jgi:hypothetical protein
MKAKEFIPANKPRNFVAKNAPKAGAGAHKDKKKAEKQGDTKHKKELVPMDEERTEVKDKDGKVTSWKDEGEWKKSSAKKDGRGKVTNLSDKARRETEKLSKKEKEVAEVAGAQKCWPGHKKVGTQPGTGKNKGKRVNDCEKIEEGRFGKDAYERDQANAEYGMNGEFKRDFKRQEMEHELGDETNNYAVSINGKSWKVFATRSHAEAVAKKIQMKDPSKKVGVHETGAPLSENTGPGVTNAASMGVGPVYKNKPPKQPKNKDGTAKNALDIDANLMTGGSIKR